MSSLFIQSIIAIIWDFDNTLIPGNMQGPIFQEFSINEGEFWDEVDGLYEYYRKQGLEVARESLYLNHLLTYALHGKFKGGLNNSLLRLLGQKLQFYAGIPELFANVKNKLSETSEFQKHEIKVENYVVSTGLRQMILGSPVAAHIDGVWGCEFIEAPAAPGYLEDAATTAKAEISQIGYVIDNTTKTRAVFEINKGCNKLAIDVNDTIAHEDRRVPFQNMIYIADGPSDVPVFSILNQYGGKTFAVYKRGDMKQFSQVYNLQKQGRIHGYGEADYREGTHTYMWIVHSVLEIARRIVENRTALLKEKVQKSPKHLGSDEMVIASPEESQKRAINSVATSLGQRDDDARNRAVSFQEFATLLNDGGVKLGDEDLKLCYRTLISNKEERQLSWEEVRAKIRRFVIALSTTLSTPDLFNGEEEERPTAHRLPSKLEDWDRF